MDSRHVGGNAVVLNVMTDLQAKQHNVYSAYETRAENGAWQFEVEIVSVTV
jgi:hypothetical protein